MQRQAPRRDEALRALIDEIALNQRVGDEPLQVLRRLPLHAGGDFFAEQFEQKVGHKNPRRRTIATSVPSPLWGRDRVGGRAKRGDWVGDGRCNG